MDMQARAETELSASLTKHTSSQLSVWREKFDHVCCQCFPVATLFQVQQAIKLLAIADTNTPECCHGDPQLGCCRSSTRSLLHHKQPDLCHTAQHATLAVEVWSA